jgi:hypothetical protein
MALVDDELMQRKEKMRAVLASLVDNRLKFNTQHKVNPSMNRWFNNSCYIRVLLRFTMYNILKERGKADDMLETAFLDACELRDSTEEILETAQKKRLPLKYIYENEFTFNKEYATLLQALAISFEEKAKKLGESKKALY